MQRRGRAVHARAHVVVIALEVLVRIPVAAREAVVGAGPDLHEANAALQQTARDQAMPAELRGDRLIEAVKPLRFARFSGRCRAPPEARSCMRAASS